MQGELIGLWLLSKGLMAGLAIAVPVGPVNVMCASRTLTRGRLAGLMSGLGAATADALYGGIAAFSITFVIQFLQREEFWIRVVGGLLLIAIGVMYFRKPGQPAIQREERRDVHSDFVSSLLLTMTNPTTVLSFLAVLAMLGLGESRTWWLTLILIGGIFTGAMIWWIILTIGSNHFRNRVTDRATIWMNRIAGLAIGGFGILMMILSRWAKR